MKVSRLAIAIKLNAPQPKGYDDIWWDAVGMFLRGNYGGHRN